MPAITREFLLGLPWAAGVQAVGALLMMQVRPWGLTSPLALGWMCAAAGGQAPARWAGVVAGALMGGGLWWLLPALAAAAWKVRGGRRTAEGDCMLAGALAVADAAVRSGGDVSAAGRWLACGLLAAAVTGVFRAQAEWPVRRAASVGLAENVQLPGRRRGRVVCPSGQRVREVEWPGREPLRHAAQLMAAAGVSAGAAWLLGGPAAMGTAALVLVHGALPAADVSAVLLAGTLAVCGVPMAAASALPAFRMSVSMLERWGRPAQALGGLAGAGVWLLAGGHAEALTCLMALTPGALSVLALPRRRSAAETVYDAMQVQLRLQRSNAGKLRAMADVLTDMAQGPSTGLDPPREDMLLLSLRARLCEGCVRYERCWNGRAGEGLRLLCDLITRSVNGTLPEKVLPDMMRRCLRADRIPTRLYAELERFAQMRRIQIARMDGAQRARLTIDTAAQLLRCMAEVPACEGLPVGLRTMETALKLAGVNGVSAALSPEGMALTRPDGWTPALCGRALHACGRAAGTHYVQVWRDGRTLCIRQAPALVARVGWDGLPAEGSRSGDSVHIGALDDRRQLVVISDGMGTGADAAGESRRAVEAVCRFLRAGIPPERAALLANQLLISQGGSEIFATMDLCLIDNGRMEATWVKMAACDSFLLRDHDCSVISGGRLPMGIVAEATPQVTVSRLRPGDVIVMGTDGAMEGLDPDTARQCLIPRRRMDVSRLAQSMRRAAADRHVHRDDQTVVVIRMEQVS